MSAPWAMLAVFAAVLLAMTGPLGGWLGAAVFLAVAPSLWPPLRAAVESSAWARRAARLVSRRGPTVVLLLVATVLLHELALGHAPASRDHGIHLFQTRILVDELIPRGTTRGWTQSLNAGYPFGDSYPVLGYVLTGATHLLTGGRVPLRVSYAWGLLAVWAVSIYAVVILGRALAAELFPSKTDGARPRSAVAWTGCVAGLAWLLDPGASRQGGWNYLMFHGVWPQQLSTALWVVGLVWFWHAAREPTPRRVAASALAFGASVLAHPFGMLTLAASGAAWIPALAWASYERRVPAGAWRWWVLAHGGAVLLSLGWLTSFFASADAMGRSPVPFEPLAQLAADLAAGELFDESRAWVAVAGVVGLGLAIRRGAPLAAMAVTTVVGLLIAASRDAITVVHLDLLVAGFKNLQFPRYVIAIKPLWAALAGAGVVWAIRAWLRDGTRSRDPGGDPPDSPRFGAWRWLAPLVFAPLLVSTCAEPSRLVPRPVGGVHALESTAHAGAERLLREALERARAERSDGRIRVAFLRGGMGGATYALFAISEVGAELVLDAHVPAINFRHWLRGRDLDTLRTLGVTHVLHDRPLDDDAALEAATTIVRTAGVWTLRSLDVPPLANPSAWILRPPSAASDPVPGVEIERGWRFEVPAAPPETTLAVAVSVAPYRRWRAEDPDGVALPVTAARVRPGLPGMVVQTRGPFTLRYVETVTERRARWLSWASLAFGLALLGFGTPLAPLPRRPWRGPAVAAAVAVALATLVLVRLHDRRLTRTWVHADGGADASARRVDARDLVLDDAWVVTPRLFPACDGLLGRDAKAGCRSADERDRVDLLYREPYLYRCLELVIDPGHARELVLFGLSPDEHLRALVDVRRGRVELEVAGQRETLARGRPHSIRAAPDDGQVVLRLANSSVGARRVCVAAAAIVSPGLERP